MSAIDILIIFVFIVSLIYGFRKGVIIQIGAVGGVVVGILACRLFGHWLTGVFAGDGADENDIYISGVFANVLLFLAGYISARIVARLVKTVTNALCLSIVDRLAGALFSLFQWFLVMSLLMNIWQAFRPDIDVTAKSTIGNGRAAKAIMNLSPKVLGSETASTIFSAIPDGSGDK